MRLARAFHEVSGGTIWSSKILVLWRQKSGRGLSGIPMLKSQASPDSAATGATGPDALLFREGMSRVAEAVHVVTTDGAAGRAGFTATAVTPVTDSPASLLVCVNTASRSAQALLANRVFCVNTLSAEDLTLAADDIKAAWRGLARQHHPDLTGDDPEIARRATRRMAEINAAYAALTRAGETTRGAAGVRPATAPTAPRPAARPAAGRTGGPPPDEAHPAGHGPRSTPAARPGRATRPPRRPGRACR